MYSSILQITTGPGTVQWPSSYIPQTTHVHSTQHLTTDLLLMAPWDILLAMKQVTCWFVVLVWGLFCWGWGEVGQFFSLTVQNNAEAKCKPLALFYSTLMVHTPSSQIWEEGRRKCWSCRNSGTVLTVLPPGTGPLPALFLKLCWQVISLDTSWHKLKQHQDCTSSQAVFAFTLQPHFTEKLRHSQERQATDHLQNILQFYSHLKKLKINLWAASPLFPE